MFPMMKPSMRWLVPPIVAAMLTFSVICQFRELPLSGLVTLAIIVPALGGIAMAVLAYPPESS